MLALEAGLRCVFTTLTDAPAGFNAVRYASISIGAVSVQPGGTGVILAGTGDPNDALDSYYGAGVLRSPDGGNTWTVMSHTADQMLSFQGEGFAGFAWSSVNPQLVVAAVSQAYEGTLVSAQLSGVSFAGLYYSTDAGASWSLATINDSPGEGCSRAAGSFRLSKWELGYGGGLESCSQNIHRRGSISRLLPIERRDHVDAHGRAARQRAHCADVPHQPRSNRLCGMPHLSRRTRHQPADRRYFSRGPSTSTIRIKASWQDSCLDFSDGIWQQPDGCLFATMEHDVCSRPDTSLGSADASRMGRLQSRAWRRFPNSRILNCLPAPMIFGAALLVMGCNWRNTTNATTCMSAQVAPYQHAIAWNPSTPQEIFIGNDSGLWRSTDAIGETGSVCSSSDASHFQNLNAGVGSLSEVESVSQVGNSPYTMMAGLGANGTAGVKSTTGPTADWPQIFDGEGGPVAIDPSNPSNWYVNSSAGVSIYSCTQNGDCTPGDFGNIPVVNDADVAGDGYTMTSPAAFIVDPLDSSKLLVGTCRLWRGPADGSIWTSANAISHILDGVSGLAYCSGDGLIRTIAALPLSGSSEVLYVGMYGALDGGATLAGHVFKATYDSTGSSIPAWEDLTLSPVLNDQVQFNFYGLDISSIFIDAHDATGNTVYVTVEGAEDSLHSIRIIYSTTDGGAHWSEVTSNLPHSPANAVVVDPQDANTVYVATDEGVYSTRQIATCINGPSNCWSVFGTGLPFAPVVQLSGSLANTLPNVLVAGTYGRARHMADSVMDFGNTVDNSVPAADFVDVWVSGRWNNKQRSSANPHQHRRNRASCRSHLVLRNHESLKRDR